MEKRIGRMRMRCAADDGTAAHVALDLELPVQITPLASGGVFGALAKIKGCACGLPLMSLGEGELEPKDDPDRYAQALALLKTNKRKREARKVGRKGGGRG